MAGYGRSHAKDLIGALGLSNFRISDIESILSFADRPAYINGTASLFP